MVIPMNVRQKGMAVRYMYVTIAMLCVSFGLSLTFSYQASALLPVSEIPIIGQPVADTVSTVTDDVVEPVVDTVTETLLPEPVAEAVQAPVEVVTDTIAPIIGPSSEPEASPQATPPQPVAQALPQASVPPTIPPSLAEPAVITVTPVTATEAPTVQAASQQSQPQDGKGDSLSSDKLPLPFMSGFVASLFGNYFPEIMNGTKNFIAASRDASLFIAASSILLIMALLLVRFVTMVIRVNGQSATADELTLMRHDLTQTSVLTLVLLIFGSLSIFALVFGSILLGL